MQVLSGKYAYFMQPNLETVLLAQTCLKRAGLSKGLANDKTLPIFSTLKLVLKSSDLQYDAYSYLTNSTYASSLMRALMCPKVPPPNLQKNSSLI